VLRTLRLFRGEGLLSAALLAAAGRLQPMTWLGIASTLTGEPFCHHQ
jgi:hypothetical protein